MRHAPRRRAATRESGGTGDAQDSPGLASLVAVLGLAVTIAAILAHAPPCQAAWPADQGSISPGPAQSAPQQDFQPIQPDWWSAIQRLTEERETRQLQQVLAPERWTVLAVEHGSVIPRRTRIARLPASRDGGEPNFAQENRH